MYKRLINSLDKSRNLSCYDSHHFGTTDSIAGEKVLVGYLGPKKKPKTKKKKLSSDKYTYLKTTDPQEMYAFITQ